MWIQTFSGQAFDLLNINPNKIFLSDIAHSLSHQCRFNGHCRVFYSVAEHCVRMANNPKLKGNPASRLFHDAAEAYIGDIPSPIKHSFPRIIEIENALMDAIELRFDLETASLDSDEIKESDLIMLSTEQRDLMSLSETPWPWRNGRPIPLNNIIIPWDSHQAKEMFMKTALILGIHCHGIKIQ